MQTKIYENTSCDDERIFREKVTRERHADGTYSKTDYKDNEVLAEVAPTKQFNLILLSLLVCWNDKVWGG